MTAKGTADTIKAKLLRTATTVIMKKLCPSDTDIVKVLCTANSVINIIDTSLIETYKLFT
jgi:hypothetical protein